MHTLFAFLFSTAVFSTTAHAGGLHAGIPVQGVDGLGAPAFHDADSGWSAPVLRDGNPVGVVRVYVGPTESAAAAWVEDAARAVQATMAPLGGLGDLAMGTTTTVVVHDGNVAFAVSMHEDDAGTVARDLLDAIVDQPVAWPTAPAIRTQGDLTFFDAPDAVELTVIGGRRPLGQPDGFQQLPTQVIAWDAWGRPAVLNP